MEINLITESIKFMVLGMTTVYLFLMLLIYILKIQAYIIQKYFSQKNEESSSKRAMPSDSQVDLLEKQNDEAILVAAITAAIAEYRKNS